MNTTALKSFAPAVRRQLIEAVARKLDFVLSAQTPDYRTTFAPQVAALRKLAQADRPSLIERVAYTWFNRLTALRFLDAKGWHPFRARVLTPASSDETQPELLKLSRADALPGELRRHTDPKRLSDLLDGHIPSSDAQGEVYRHLVLAACRFYHALLPNLFERLDDETELLLPDDLLTRHSVAHGFRTEITDTDCAEVEILGWLYQFYIAEKKDEVMARKKAVASEDIPAVTQIFTPHWIVRYLVENSLGRLWLLNRPSSRLRERMPYYIAGDAESNFLRVTRPEEIRLLDPAVGSGHMLTYAFDLLYAIYEEEGYTPSEIPALILAHNLHGIDICPRAAQIAALALMLKARERSRSIFQGDKLVEPHILALQNIQFGESEVIDYVRGLSLHGVFNEQILKLLTQFEEAATFGSLVLPCVDEATTVLARRAIEAKDLAGQLFLHTTHTKVLRAFDQAEMLCQRYHVVVANPPYMGGAAMNPLLKEFIENSWKTGKADTYAAFILRNITLALHGGAIAMITIPNWMFLRSFADLRKTLLETTAFDSLIQCGRGVWGSDFGSCAFVLRASSDLDHVGHFKRLSKRQGEVQSNEQIAANFFNARDYPSFTATSRDLRKIPTWPIAYWVSRSFRNVFSRSTALRDIAVPRQGMATTNNGLFLRQWFEVGRSSIGLNQTSEDAASKSGLRWFPYNKGGKFRRWYGNQDYVVNYENNGKTICDYIDNTPGVKVGSNGRVINRESFFKPSVSWSKVTIGGIAFRHFPSGFIFDVAGCSIIFGDEQRALTFLAFLNSKLTDALLAATSPTVNFEAGQLAEVPVIREVIEAVRMDAQRVSSSAIALAKADWNNSETSWNFRDLPLLRAGTKETTLQASWLTWKTQSDAARRQMQELETENNRLFIGAYGLQAEIAPEVAEDQVTLANADVRKDMAGFLSYAVGCMMGRYSLDAPGLILADSSDKVADYLAKVRKPMHQLAFPPDDDAIIPVLEGEWFEDDIVARTRAFLRATFGEATLRENVRFIEESLGKDLRKYFLADFYKDHLQTYRKRPIYWLVQSPRKGFSVLIYLHRYTRDAMNLVLNRYLREYQAKLRSRLVHLAQAQVSEATSARDKTAARKEADKLTKTLRECEEWERDTLLPLAQVRIELDLDDGVKTNYLKLGEALALIPGLAVEAE
jgi:hypothetical protein